MTKRRTALPGKTVDGRPRIRRVAAVGEELTRLIGEVFKAISAAGVAGVARHELVHSGVVGRYAAAAVLRVLRSDRRIYVASWRRGQPAFAAGCLPDVPRPPSEVVGKRGLRSGGLDTDFAEIARQEILNTHARWLETWTPHRDPAAAWFGSPA